MYLLCVKLDETVYFQVDSTRWPSWSQQARSTLVDPVLLVKLSARVESILSKVFPAERT